MNTRRVLAVGVPVLIVGGALVAWLARARQSEVVLTTELHLGPEWREIKPSSAFEATHEWSELLVEIPHLRLDGAEGYVTTDHGERIRVEGYLTTSSGERVELDRVSAVGLGTRTCLQLSSSLLEGRRYPLSFVAVTVRSEKALAGGKLVWISYDPSATKDGVAWPEAFR